MVAAFLRSGGGEILAPGEPEMIGPKEPNTVIGGVRQASILLVVPEELGSSKVGPDSTKG
jgi:hypothetical protein